MTVITAGLAKPEKNRLDRHDAERKPGGQAGQRNDLDPEPLCCIGNEHDEQDREDRGLVEGHGQRLQKYCARIFIVLKSVIARNQ